MPTEAVSPADLRNYLGFGFQTVKGTEVAPTEFLTFVDQISFDHNPNVRQIREAGGGQTIARMVKDYIAPGVEAATPIRPDIIGAVLAAALGADVVSGAGPFVHTITRSPSVVWLTFERGISDDLIERIVDGVITGVTLNFQKRDSGPELVAAITAIGISEQVEAAPTAESYEIADPLTRSMCAWTIDGVAGVDNVESATIDIQWTVDDTILADQVTRSSIVKLHIEASIEVVQLWESAAEKDAYLATHYGTPAGTVPSEIVYQGSFQVVATDPTSTHSLNVQIPVVDWTIATVTEPDPDASEAMRLTRQGDMIANPGGEPITAVVTNGTTLAYV